MRHLRAIEPERLSSVNDNIEGSVLLYTHNQRLTLTKCARNFDLRFLGQRQ